MATNKKPAPVNYICSAKETITASLACLGSIFIIALLTQLLLPGQAPLLIGSLGASAAILFVVPSSPLAQPWACVGGQVVSALVGVSVLHVTQDVMLGAALAVGLAVLLMLCLRCLHPPGAATALTPILSAGSNHFTGLHFILLPVASNALMLVVLAVLINRYLLRRDYPMRAQSSFLGTLKEHDESISGTDSRYAKEIQQVVDGFGSYLDVSQGDLQRFYREVQLLTFRQRQADITCANIMIRDVVSVEYDTDVETAWILMQQHGLKVLPVLDKVGKVIGIVTWYDFLKYVRLSPYVDFQQKFLNFIRKTHDITTSKPESVGHIMSRKVRVLAATAHFSALVTLMVDEGHRHVPIVDQQGRLVGLVQQQDFIAILYDSKARVIPDPE